MPIRTSTLAELLPLQHENTQLRRFLITDLASFHACRNDPVLARFQSWSALSEAQAHRFVAEMSSLTALLPGEWIQLAVADAALSRWVGDVGLFAASDGAEGEVGFTLERAAQGQGHATRALQLAVKLFFSCSNANVLRAVTDARNTASVGVLERAAFHKVREQATDFKGELCTEWVYELRRE